jgi:DNA-binding CsgD family transcriptional regulator
MREQLTAPQRYAGRVAGCHRSHDARASWSPAVLPPLCTSAEAQPTGEQLERLSAHVLDWLATSVPFAAALASPVDRRLNLYTSRPLVIRTDGQDPALDIEQLLLEYLRHGRALDPFAPSRWNQSVRAVISGLDVGGDESLARSSYAEFLAAHQLAAHASLFFREGERIVWAIVLLRRRTQGEATYAQIRMLRRWQPFLEQALTLARRSAGAVGDGLPLGALTPRELDVVQLAATGASNAEIGRALRMSVATVKSHMTHAMAKLDVRSRTGLVARMGSLREPPR